MLLLEFVGLGTARQALGTLGSERLVLGPQGSIEGWCCPLVVEHGYPKQQGFGNKDHLLGKY